MTILSPVTKAARWVVPTSVVVVAIVFTCQLLAGSSAISVTSYALWSGAWWLLGFAILRRRSAQNQFTRLTLGAAVGVVGQLLWWAVCQAIGLPPLTPLGGLAAALVAAFLLRRPAQPAAAGPPPFAVLSWAAATAWAAARAVAFFARQAPPPGPSTMYQDLYWHLGLAGELKHSLLPQTPQAQVGQLNYHWLSDAYIAVGSLGSGRPTADIALRLWVVPIVAVITALCLVVGHRLSGNWLTGSIGAALLVWPAGLTVVPWFGSAPVDGLGWLSPSQIFGLMFTLLALFLIIPLLRGERLSGRKVVLVAAVAFLCAGAKSSILPVLAAGALFAAAVFVRRKAARRGALVVSAISALGIVVALPLFAGGSAGSKLRLFSSARHSWPYASYVHQGRGPGHGPLLPPGLLSTGAVVVLLGVLVAMLSTYAIAALSLLLGRRWLRDPMPAFLVGCILASLAAYQLIDHTGGSQAYFPLGAQPMVGLLAGWGISVAAGRSPHPRRWIAAVAAGAATTLILRLVLARLRPPAESLPWLTASAVILLVVGGAALIRPAKKHVALIAALLVGACLVNPAAEQNFGRTLATPFAAPLRQFPWTVQPAESAAAHWLGDHSGSADLVATNVHCRNLRTTPGCLASAFWVSGFSGRRMLVESWSYTDGAQRAAGDHGLPAVRQPFPDGELFTLNERAFYAPNPQVLGALRARGVRWMFADNRAGEVSGTLASLADAVHRSGPVTIYRLR
ncbi:hypothetical protein [Calidifontibacter terrae]